MIKLSTRIITNKNNHNDPLKTALRFPSQSVSADVWLLLPSMQKIQVLTIFFFFFFIVYYYTIHQMEENYKETQRD